MAKVKEMSEREDELAIQEYEIEFADLPGDIKQEIHNRVLAEFGKRQQFTFECDRCHKTYKDFVEGHLVTEYVREIKKNGVISVTCPACIKKIEKEEEEADFAAKAGRVFGSK